ncbi:hypothetical protein M9Y10_003248 [Tritrichomonas musculus]|uniref:Serine/threonine-protein phosphatase n=1 Tax=Tritrichomonas musculus TaxID=1915356 RepID=A0ABR2JP77_9EUKA
MNVSTTENYSQDTLPVSLHHFRSLFYQFLHSAREEIEFYARNKTNLIFPNVSKSTMIDLCHEAELIFRTEASLIDIQSPCLIIGDIHGHVLDLLRILKHCGVPHEDHLDPRFKDGSNIETTYKQVPNLKYIFLGDLIDRGEFSVETITIVFLLKVLFPTNVYIIRGNHEFDFLAKQCGFLAQVCNIFTDEDVPTFQESPYGEVFRRESPGSQVYSAFMSSFSYLPFGIRIDEKMLCVHGGIGPRVTSINSVSDIVRPINDFGMSEVADSLLWSDPFQSESAEDKTNQKNKLPFLTIDEPSFSEPIVTPLQPMKRSKSDVNSSATKFFEPSNRGTGFIFGYPALDHFLNSSDLEVLVRAHECVLAGCEELFNGRLITVFSASNYCGFVKNYSAILHVKSKTDENDNTTILNRCEVFRFIPLDYLKKPVPITINISRNLDTFSPDHTNLSSARVIELSGYYKRYSSQMTKNTPITQLIQKPLKQTKVNYPKSDAQNNNSNNDDNSNENNTQFVSLRDPHKLAGLKGNAPSTFVRRDVSQFRQNQLLNKLPKFGMKRTHTHQAELPAFIMPKASNTVNKGLASSQNSTQTFMDNDQPVISLIPKLKPHPKAEMT